MVNDTILGHRFTFRFGENAVYELRFLDDDHLEVTVVADAHYSRGTVNHFDTTTTEIRPNVYMITWIEPQTGNTVTHVDDFQNHVAYTNITDLASRGFWRLKGSIEPIE